MGWGGGGGSYYPSGKKAQKGSEWTILRSAERGLAIIQDFSRFKGGGAGLLFSLTQKKPVNLEARKNCSISYRLFFEKMMGLGRGRGGELSSLREKKPEKE